MQALQTEGFLYATTWVLYLVSDALYLITFPALYYVLKRISRATILIAVILNTSFAALDVGLDIPLRLSLIGLSNSYSSVQSASQQASILASAQSALNLSNEVAVIATVFQFLAVILAGALMLKSGSFRKSFGYLGIAAGILAILFIPAFVTGSQLAGLFNIAGFVLLGVWSILGGLRLRKITSSTHNT